MTCVSVCVCKRGGGRRGEGHVAGGSIWAKLSYWPSLCCCCCSARLFAY